jgi:hypothetical protein
MALIPALAALAALSQFQTPPALWVQPDGRISVDGQTVKPRMLGGTRIVRMDGVIAYDFDGHKGGLLFDDAPQLKLVGSMTVSVWLNLRSYVNEGPGAQVLFRGDDRCGLDPYSMSIHSDGTLNFGIQGSDDKGRSVTAEIPLGRWVHVLGNFDFKDGRLEMWMDGKLVGLAYTEYRPFANLDPNWAPGVSVGNVQNDTGPHNQPLNGMVADLRLYRGVYRPDDLLLGRGGWVEPPIR